MASKKRTSALVLGTGLILGAMAGLFYNEWRSASRLATLHEAERSVVAIAPSHVDPGLEGGLVHLTGEVVIQGRAEDPLLGIAADVPRLDRRVEMYQWREISEGSGDDRRYRHERVWAEGRIASERFHERVGHTNPPAPPMASERFRPSSVEIGRYALAAEIIDLPSADRPIDVGGPRNIEGVLLSPHGDVLHSGDPGRPQIGDIRVTMRAVEPGVVSVMGKLVGGTLGLWRASNDGELAFFEHGEVEPAAMIEAARDDNSRRTWMFRLGLPVVIFMGMTIIIKRLARMVPIIGALAAKLLMPVALVLTIAVSLLIIAVGWLAFRPLLSLSLLAVGAVVLFLLRWMRASSPEEDLAHAATPPPPPR